MEENEVFIQSKKVKEGRCWVDVDSKSFKILVEIIKGK